MQVKSNNISRDCITNTVQILFLQSSTWILEFFVRTVSVLCTVFVMQSLNLICYCFSNLANVVYPYLRLVKARSLTILHFLHFLQSNTNMNSGSIVRSWSFVTYHLYFQSAMGSIFHVPLQILPIFAVLQVLPFLLKIWDTFLKSN